jgi:hypothetical protein
MELIRLYLLQNESWVFNKDQPEKETFKNDDHFKDLFSNTPLNWVALAVYFLGFVCCGLLGMVSYFERSGLAGPYRPVINQMTSFAIDQVSFGQQLNQIV